MIRATFLAHSGFLIELDTVCLLFDWWKGDLPALPGKPLVCFVSHRHEDHFSPRIFNLEAEFVLSRDIRRRPEGAHVMGWDQRLDLPGVTVETLRSTDEGVAFLVTADGQTVYHAGDLNWWHWEGEDRAWNRNMEVNFKRYLEPLRGRRIDLAMVPLDPRQEGAEDWGLTYLLELAEVRRVLPMHQWNDYTPTARFLAAHPAWADRIIPITGEGQTFSLNTGGQP